MSGKHRVETSGVFFVFFQYVPYIIVSLFAGTFVDRHSKKKIMLASDSIAAFCSLGILLLNTGNDTDRRGVFRLRGRIFLFKE